MHKTMHCQGFALAESLEIKNRSICICFSMVFRITIPANFYDIQQSLLFF